MSQDDWNQGFVVGVTAGMAPLPNNFMGIGGGSRLVIFKPKYLVISDGILKFNLSVPSKVNFVGGDYPIYQMLNFFWNHALRLPYVGGDVLPLNIVSQPSLQLSPEQGIVSPVNVNYSTPLHFQPTLVP